MGEAAGVAVGVEAAKGVRVGSAVPRVLRAGVGSGVGVLVGGVVGDACGRSSVVGVQAMCARTTAAMSPVISSRRGVAMRRSLAMPT